MVAGAWRSPWETPDILELLTSGEKVISAALWRCNKHRETTWTIPLDVFCREGWGDAETRIETVKSRVSKLVKKLNELGVELSVTVRKSKSFEQVECSFVPKYQGFSFPRKP
jgi:hypothetical protein